MVCPPFDVFTQALMIRHCNVNVRSIRLCCGGIASSSVRVVTCCCSSSYFHSVNCPCWVFASFQGLV